MAKFKIDISEKALKSDKLSREILLASALQLYKQGRLQVGKAAELAGLPQKQFLMEVEEESVPDEPASPIVINESLQSKDAIYESRYLARVLWALTEGERQNLTPMTAAEISKFVSANTNVKIQHTNTARFFRSCREDGKFQDLWTVSSRGARRLYSLTEKGRKTLKASVTGSRIKQNESGTEL